MGSPDEILSAEEVSRLARRLQGSPNSPAMQAWYFMSASHEAQRAQLNAERQRAERAEAEVAKLTEELDDVWSEFREAEERWDMETEA